MHGKRRMIVQLRDTETDDKEDITSMNFNKMTHLPFTLHYSSTEKQKQKELSTTRPLTLFFNGKTKTKRVINNKTAMADHFLEIQIPQQRNYNSVSFPSVLSPNPTANTAVPFSVSHLTEAIRTKKPFLDSLLYKTGAVLFRGFDVKTAKDFNDVVEAFGYVEFPYVGGRAPRTNVEGRVYTANESPPDQKIGFHHELAQASESPTKLFFFCEVAPTSGGETPIVLSHIVYERIKQRYSKFVEKLEEHGLIHSLLFQADDDLSSPVGRGWKSTFATEDKSVAEERATKLGIKLEWMEDGGAKRITGPVPIIKFDKSRQRKVWFTSMVDWEDVGRDPVKATTFGDGTPLPADFCYACLKILEEECVAIPWQEGDILLLDNWAVLHGRRPTNSPRRVLASLCK